MSEPESCKLSEWSKDALLSELLRVRQENFELHLAINTPHTAVMTALDELRAISDELWEAHAHGDVARISDAIYELRETHRRRAAREPGPVVTPTSTFEEAWAATGYQYGDEELEGVKLGWELAIKSAARPPAQPPITRDQLANRLYDWCEDGRLHYSDRWKHLADCVLSLFAARPQPAQPVVKPRFEVTLEEMTEFFATGPIFASDAEDTATLNAILAKRPQPAPSDAGAVVWTKQLAERLMEAYHANTEDTPRMQMYRAGFAIGLDKLSVKTTDQLAAANDYASMVEMERDKLRAELSVMEADRDNWRDQYQAGAKTLRRELTEARETLAGANGRLSDVTRSNNAWSGKEYQQRTRAEAAEARVKELEAELEEAKDVFRGGVDDGSAVILAQAIRNLHHAKLHNWERAEAAESALAAERANYELLAQDYRAAKADREQAEMLLLHERSALAKLREACAWRYKHTPLDVYIQALREADYDYAVGHMARIQAALAAAPVPVEALKPNPKLSDVWGAGKGHTPLSEDAEAPKPEPETAEEWATRKVLFGHEKPPAGWLERRRKAKQAETAKPDKCTRCGHPASEHHYNGACYGLCGEFVAQPAKPDELAELRGRLEKQERAMHSLLACISEFDGFDHIGELVREYADGHVVGEPA